MREMKCNQCGTEMVQDPENPDMMFCPKCGWRQWSVIELPSPELSDQYEEYEGESWEEAEDEEDFIMFDEEEDS